MNKDELIREQICELLTGGFAPVVILLKEFAYEKTGIALDGLPFSVYSLLEHMRHRQNVLLRFMKNPEETLDVWPKAHWPENPVPKSREVWEESINSFEHDLREMMAIVQNQSVDLFAVHENGKTLSWAAMTAFHHNAYTIGQIKAIGRQLGVW